MDNRFTAEQIEKAKECKTAEELFTIAKENGIELTEAEATNLFAQLNPAFGELSDSELETVAGGCGNGDEDENVKCPVCGSASWKKYISTQRQISGPRVHKGRLVGKECKSCGHKWDEYVE